MGMMKHVPGMLVGAGVALWGLGQFRRAAHPPSPVGVMAAPAEVAAPAPVVAPAAVEAPVVAPVVARQEEAPAPVCASVPEEGEPAREEGEGPEAAAAAEELHRALTAVWMARTPWMGLPGGGVVPWPGGKTAVEAQGAERAPGRGVEVYVEGHGLGRVVVRVGGGAE